MKWLTLFFVLLLAHTHTSAQVFGGFPPGTRWRQIDTDTARVIFTAEAGAQADRIATLIHRAAEDTALLLGSRLRKINVLLQGRTTQANGYVALAPFRSEFFLVPGSNIFDFGNLPWYENLAIHEYRHVQQYNHFRRGISKAFYFLFGEGGLALGNALSVPDWFFEGDAVHAETALTTQGRGRLPFFLSGYQSLWQDGRNYSWMKLRNGSLKDYVPNHYQLGYLLTNYGYLKYGNRFWGNVTADASAFKGLLYPFQQAVKKHSGLRYQSFRNDALNFYKQQPAAEAVQAVRTRTVNNVFFPTPAAGGGLVYLRTAYNKLPAFFERRNGRDRKIALRSISSEEWISQKNGQLAYTAYSTHPRWGLIDYSDVVLMDVATGRERRLTQKKRYYTPDLSPSGSKLAAVRINDSLETVLELLDAKDGHLLSSFALPTGSYWMNPRFVDEDRIVISVRSADSKMQLQVLNLATKEEKVLLPYSTASVGLPQVQGDTVYLTAGYSGNDELYAYDLKAAQLFQLTQSKTGNYYGGAAGEHVYWSKFTSYGLQLQQKRKADLLWQPVAAPAVLPAKTFPVAAAQNILPVRTRRYSEKRYSQSTGLFNFHSWQPNYVDPEASFSLLSDNILSTFSNELFYRYNQNETAHTVGWNTAYAALFPVITAGVEYTRGRDFAFRNNTLTLDNVEARVGYNIPLNFTKGKSYKNLRFGSSYVFNRTMARGFFKDSLKAFNSSYLSHFVNWSHYLPMARQHIYPKLGFATTVQHRHLLNDDGYQFFNNSFLYLPAPGNHSIVLNTSFQQRDTNSIVFSNRFANARGFDDYNLSRLWKLGANYHLPLLYPDFGLANIVYLQRIRANAFYDFARGYSNNKRLSRDFQSIGGEMYFDTRWWNQLPVTVGFRVSHLLSRGLLRGEDKGQTFFEFILPVSLIPN